MKDFCNIYYCKHEGIIPSLYQIVSIIAYEGYQHLLHDVCMQCLVINIF